MTDSPALDRVARYLADLIAFPTVSRASNLDMIDYLAAVLRDLGARVEVLADPTATKANLFATLGPDGDGGIVLSGHTDVVPVEGQAWASDPFVLTERDGNYYGRGTCDMKGFIACTLVAAEDYAAAPLAQPVHFAFTYDEEIGCLGGQALVADLVARGLSPAAAIIGEPTEMRVIEGHKGCKEITTRFTGLAGHSSQPDLGVNAVEYAARYITELMRIREGLKDRAPADSRFDPPWSTLQIGAITGGIAANVIAESAEVAWDLRCVRTDDEAFVDTAIEAHVRDVLLPAMTAVSASAAIETEVIGNVVGLSPVSDSVARDIVCELTGANGTDVVAFGTEAGLFQKAGISAVVCGPGSIAQAHKADEFVSRDQLAAGLAMLRRLSQKLSD